MNVVFLTMVSTPSLENKGIYTDLLRLFVEMGHKVFVVFPRERRLGKGTEEYFTNGVKYLAVRTFNLQKTNVIEKGVGQILVEGQYKSAIKKYWKHERFDLILYSTPPITLIETINYLRKHNQGARTYLLLKDMKDYNNL